MVKAYNRTFDSRSWTEYKGLSNDPRPLNPKEGDVFIETDTLDVYAFVDGAWTQVYPYLNVGSFTLPSDGTLPGIATEPIQQ